MANVRTQWMIWKDHIKRKVLRMGETKLDIRQSWAKTPAVLADADRKDFLDWFDATDSVEGTLKRAEADWLYRFASWPYFASVKRGSALEIGFGAGRLALQASRVFGAVKGIDIHEAFDQTRSFLMDHGASNVELIHRSALDQSPCPIQAGQIDFAYSFIVIQHFDRADELWFYMRKLREWLAPGGYAHLYFGKNSEPGFRETSAEAFRLRDASLFIHPVTMEEKARSLGFEIVERRDRLAKNPFTGEGESMQASIVLKNPA